MQLNTIGQVFITRTLKLSHTLSTDVTITIGKPQKFPDGQDYYCPFQIMGLGDEKVNRVGGIDEVQALLLALEDVGTRLSETEEYKQGHLTWIGSDEGNLGFPHLDSAGMLTQFLSKG
jgi:hypothetical protein